MSFGLGVMLGALIASLVAHGTYFFLERGNVTLDRWWLENTERWEWVRQYELDRPDREAAS